MPFSYGAYLPETLALMYRALASAWLEFEQWGEHPTPVARLPSKDSKLSPSPQLTPWPAELGTGAYSPARNCPRISYAPRYARF